MDSPGSFSSVTSSVQPLLRLWCIYLCKEFRAIWVSVEAHPETRSSVLEFKSLSIFRLPALPLRDSWYSQPTLTLALETTTRAAMRGEEAHFSGLQCPELPTTNYEEQLLVTTNYRAY